MNKLGVTYVSKVLFNRLEPEDGMCVGWAQRQDPYSGTGCFNLSHNLKAEEPSSARHANGLPIPKSAARCHAGCRVSHQLSYSPFLCFRMTVREDCTFFELTSFPTPRICHAAWTASLSNAASVFLLNRTCVPALSGCTSSHCAMSWWNTFSLHGFGVSEVIILAPARGVTTWAR